MAITSIGYEGSVSEVQWASLAPYLGKDPCVANSTAWAPSLVSGVDRTVRLASGTGYGWGVLDTSSANVDVQLDTVASGTRWDAIVMHRDWQPTPGLSSFVKVNGTSTKAIPAGLAATPGTTADQVVALAQVTAGQQVPTALIDLRVAPDGGVYNQDAATLLGRPLTSGVYVNATLASGVVTTAQISGDQTLRTRARRDGDVHMAGAVGLSGNAAFPGGQVLIGTLTAAHWPGQTTPFACTCEHNANYNTVRGQVGIDGKVYVFIPSVAAPKWVSFWGVTFPPKGV